MAPQYDYHRWKKAAKPKKLDEKDDEGISAVDVLDKYFKQLEKWGREVRLDIIRLEGVAGLSKGDPGDPPEGPFD